MCSDANLSMASSTKISMTEAGRLRTKELLALRFCDFDWSLDQLPKKYQALISLVLSELRAKDIGVIPDFYAAKEWLCAEGSTSIGLPFYVMQPKFAALEKRFKKSAEGLDDEGFLKLLRHEIGHCLDHAFGISKQKAFLSVFGSPYKKYQPEFYNFDPRSQNFVSHLPDHYAQSHPLEDFAETFAVWLDPKSNWKNRYAKQPGVIKKLLFVDRVMNQVKHKHPLGSYPPLWAVQKSVMPIGLHYKRQISALEKFSLHATIKVGVQKNSLRL